MEAVPKVLSSAEDAVIIILRGHGNERDAEKIRRKMETIDHGGRVIFIDRRITLEEMAIYLNLSDVFVSIPSSDQFGSAVIEGMACGVFPVVSDIEVFYQYFRDGENALFAQLDPGDVADKIILSLKNDDLRRKAAVINRKIVEENEDAEKCALRMEELYRSLVEKRPP